MRTTEASVPTLPVVRTWLVCISFEKKSLQIGIFLCFLLWGEITDKFMNWRHKKTQKQTLTWDKNSGEKKKSPLDLLNFYTEKRVEQKNKLLCLLCLWGHSVRGESKNQGIKKHRNLTRLDPKTELTNNKTPDDIMKLYSSLPKVYQKSEA